MTDPLNGTKNLFGLLRHGQTEWNIEKRIQGYGNSPLTAEGREQTAKWVETLRAYGWDRILASDLGRVRETVAILNAHLRLPVDFDPRLREQGWGEWEGLTLPYVQETFREELARRVAMGWEFSAPGGETRNAVRARVFSALREAAGNWPGRNILVVCHQGVIKTALYHITGREFQPGEDSLLQHNRLHIISLSEAGFAPVQLNIPRRTP